MLPVEQIYAENLALKERIAELEAQIEWLKRKIFGGGQSEKLPLAHPAQTHLALPGLPEPLGEHPRTPQCLIPDKGSLSL